MFLLLAKEIKHRVIDPMGDEPEEPQVRGPLGYNATAHPLASCAYNVV